MGRGCTGGRGLALVGPEMTVMGRHAGEVATRPGAGSRDVWGDPCARLSHPRPPGGVRALGEGSRLYSYLPRGGITARKPHNLLPHPAGPGCGAHPPRASATSAVGWAQGRSGDKDGVTLGQRGHPGQRPHTDDCGGPGTPGMGKANTEPPKPAAWHPVPPHQGPALYPPQISRPLQERQ